MSNPSTIDSSSLSDVTGAGSSTNQTEVGVQVTPPKGPVNVGVNNQQSQTDYYACLQAVLSRPTSTPSDIKNTCGLPPASRARV